MKTKPTAKKSATKAAPAKKVAAKKVAAKKAATPAKKAAPAKKVAQVKKTVTIETLKFGKVLPDGAVETSVAKTEVVEVSVPVPAPIVLPKSAPPPDKIELVHEGKAGQGKRYVSKTEPDSKYHLRDRSEAEKPVSIVRRICEANPALERKPVIALCIAAGVNKNTAATQYSLWKAAKAKAAAAAAKGESEEGDDEE